MTGWTVSIEAMGEHPAPARSWTTCLGEMVEALLDHGGSVSGTTDRTRYGATLSIDPADSPRSAIEVALHEFAVAARRAELPDWPVVKVEALTHAELDAELASPLVPELVGVSEVAELLGVSRQRASDLQNRHGFPDPVAILASGPVWMRKQLNSFTSTWDRKPGRPRRDAATA